MAPPALRQAQGLAAIDAGVEIVLILQELTRRVGWDESMLLHSQSSDEFEEAFMMH